MLRSALNSHFDGHSTRPLGNPGTLRRPTSALRPSATPISRRLSESKTKEAAGNIPSNSHHPEGVSPEQVLAPPSVPLSSSSSPSTLPRGGGGGGGRSPRRRQSPPLSPASGGSAGKEGGRRDHRTPSSVGRGQGSRRRGDDRCVRSIGGT